MAKKKKKNEELWMGPQLEEPVHSSRQWNLPQGALKASLFLLMAVTAFAFMLYGLMFVYYNFVVDPDNGNTDPSFRGKVPTTVLTAPAETSSPDAWDPVMWLTQAEARELRQQANVNNLAFIAGNNVRYSTHTVQFAPDQGWREVDTIPLNVTTYRVSGTALIIEAEGQTHTLNVMMPFSFASRSDEIYLVDFEGVWWEINVGQISLVAVPGANPPALPVNPDLSLTIR